MLRIVDRRRRIVMCAAALVAGVTALSAQTPPAAPPAASPAAPAAVPQGPALPTPVFRAETDVVVVEATVLDRKGVVVPGLGPADFKVEIEGRRRHIVSADFVGSTTAPTAPAADAIPAELDISTNEAHDTGRVILLLIDQASLRSESRAVIDAAREWVLSLDPKDMVGLAAFPQPGARVDFTRNHATVAEMLKRVTGIGTPPPPFNNHNVGIWEAFRIETGDTYIRNDVVSRECRGEPLCASEVDMQSKTMAMDAQAVVQPVLRNLRAMVRALEVIPGPKHVVLLSSGWPIRESDAATELGFVASDAARANVIVHTFTADLWALAASRSRPSLRSIEDQNLLLNSVEMLSSLTGGRAVRLTGAAGPAFASLNGGLSGYYRLGVEAVPADLDGKTRRIALSVTRPGASVSAYRRILAATRTEPAAAVDPELTLRDALKGGPQRTGVGLRATSYVLHALTPTRQLRVVAIGDVTRAAAGTAKVVAALYDLDGRPVTAMENTVQVQTAGTGALQVELTALPANYVLRVAVLDAQGRIGSVERLIDVRWKNVGGLETPGLVLFRAEGPDDSAGPVLDTVTTADQLTAQLSLSGPVELGGPQVAFEITRQGETLPLLRRAARIRQTTGGTTVAQDTLPASMLPPGRYQMTARVGRDATLARAFTVTVPAAAVAKPTAAVPTVAARPAANATALAFSASRFTTASVLEAGFVAPLIDRLAARPDTAAVRAALERSKAGPWTTDSDKGPLTPSPLAAHFVAGLGRLQAGQLEEAVQAFRTALKTAPDFTPSLIYLGACYAASGKHQEAAGAWQVALVRERTLPDLQRLAIEAWLRAGKPAPALALLQQARQRWPEDDSFPRLQAQVALVDGRPQEGLDLVAQLKQPDQPTLLLALTTLYDAWRRQTPVWSDARDLETMRRLRESYAAVQGESLALVDAWVSEMAPAAQP